MYAQADVCKLQSDCVEGNTEDLPELAMVLRSATGGQQTYKRDDTAPVIPP